MNPNEVIVFVLTHSQEFLCLGTMGAFVGVVGFGFIKMMGPIDDVIAEFHQQEQREIADRAVFIQALENGVVTDGEEKKRALGAKRIDKPDTRRDSNTPRRLNNVNE